LRFVPGSGVSVDESSELRSVWWLLLLVGLLSAIAGVILITKPSDSLATLAVIVGIFLLIDGIAELVMSLLGSREHRGLAAILGVLGIVIGIVLIRHPVHGVTAIGLLIGIWLVAAGVIRIFRAVALGFHVGIRLLLGALEMVVGIVIVSDPHIGYTALAVITGIWLVVSGIGSIAFAIALRFMKSEQAAPEQSSGRLAL
jgi:uncharacterized membrane protein HdeD (DUF308 family)